MVKIDFLVVAQGLFTEGKDADSSYLGRD